MCWAIYCRWGKLYLGGRMAFRISSFSCLVASVEADFGLGGGGTGPESTGCWGLTLRGRPCSEKYTMLHVVYCKHLMLTILSKYFLNSWLFIYFFTLQICNLTQYIKSHSHLAGYRFSTRGRWSVTDRPLPHLSCVKYEKRLTQQQTSLTDVVMLMLPHGQ